MVSQQPTSGNAWDRPRFDTMSREQMLEVIESAPTCVFIRLRSDGHPIGAVVGHNVLDGEIYTITNVHRAAYQNVLRDSRCCAVFDVPEVASVTVVGRGEIVSDKDILDRFYDKHSRNHYMVRSERQTREEFLAFAYTENRRLVHILPEKMFGTDLRTLRTR
jgi:general stress protein 26